MTWIMADTTDRSPSPEETMKLSGTSTEKAGMPGLCIRIKRGICYRVVPAMCTPRMIMALIFLVIIFLILHGASYVGRKATMVQADKGILRMNRGAKLKKLGRQVKSKDIDSKLSPKNVKLLRDIGMDENDDEGLDDYLEYSERDLATNVKRDASVKQKRVSSNPARSKLKNNTKRGLSVGTPGQSTKKKLKNIPLQLSGAKSQEFRRNKVFAACKSTDLSAEQRATKLTGIAKRHLLVDDERKVLYCLVPGGASMAIISKFLVMMGQPQPTKMEYMTLDAAQRLLPKNKMKPLTEYPKNKVVQVLKNYYSFVFVSDTIQRLWEAFQQFFINISEKRSPFTERFESAIQREAFAFDKIGVGKRTLKQVLPQQQGFSFLQFLKYIIRMPPHLYDERWQRISSLCDPCNVRYRFIGKIETQRQDLISIYKTIFNNTKLPKTTHNTYSSAMPGGVPEALKDHIANIFSDDSRLFSYSPKGSSKKT